MIADLERACRAWSDHKTSDDGWERSDWLKNDIRKRAVKNYGANMRAALLAYHRSRVASPEEVEAVQIAICCPQGCKAEKTQYRVACRKIMHSNQARAALAASDAYRVRTLEALLEPGREPS